MSPTHVRGRNGKLYRYYVSASLQQGARASPATAAGDLQRVSAPALEGVVQHALARILPQEAQPMERIGRIEVLRRSLKIRIKTHRHPDIGPLGPGEDWNREPGETCTYTLTLPIMLARAGSRIIIAGTQTSVGRRDPVLIAALRRAHALFMRDGSGPNLMAVPTSQYGRRLAVLALLAPDIQRDILAGRQPGHLTLAALMSQELPFDWGQQRLRLGFAGSEHH